MLIFHRLLHFAHSVHAPYSTAEKLLTNEIHWLKKAKVCLYFLSVATSRQATTNNPCNYGTFEFFSYFIASPSCVGIGKIDRKL